ncbi:MAG TPA: OmpA family protein [Anaeromyxobacteraceae bacterium]|nr:OmpA family protein [Anaeromyxobacteraceae bacterium]
MAHLPRTALALGLALAAACGVPEEKYKAAISESGRLKAGLDAESQRARDLEAKLAEESAKRKASEERAAAAESSKAQLEQAASRLAAEKTQLEKKSAEYEALSKSLSGEIQAGRIQISELQGKMTVRLAEKVLFPSGSATLSRDGKATLAKVADAFKDLKDRIVRVEGHTDNVPIKSAAFPSNWELSAARAIAVVRFLESAGVDPAKLAAAGYGEWQPIAPNDTPEGRAQNRRIEISLATR